MSIKEKIEQLKRRIEQVARRADEIKLVAVVKNVEIPLIEQAILAGVTDLGINRVQEAAEKVPLIKQKFPNVTWHMIGHLQRNKVRQALDIFDIIQSVDSERLVEEISRRSVKPIPILIEVNTSGEESKNGVRPDKTIELVRFAAGQKNIQVQGLMTIGPVAADPRPSFRCLREIKDEIARLALPGVVLEYLSMGMTDDFEIAIEEGANIVRIGRAIFQ